MDELTIAMAALVGLLILIYSGMHIGVALALVSFLGVWALKGNPHIASMMVTFAVSESISTYTFGVIPLFILMGLVVSESDIGRDSFDLADKVFHRLDGGLAIATVAANALFAAITGATIASATVFTKVAVPELIRRGYTGRFSVGVVAGSSVLGMLIPPSVLMIIFGAIAEVSIGKLFIAGILPGLVLAVAYSIMISFLAKKFPRFVTGDSSESEKQFEEFGLGRAVIKGLPIVVLIFVVLGGIWTGIFTPTESGGVGAAGALILAILKRKMSLHVLWNILLQTGYATASVAFLIMAAQVYANMLALAGVPSMISDFMGAAGLGPYGVLIVFILLALAMGTIIDSVSIILITVPLFLPLMTGFGFDLVWWGIVTIIAVEAGLLTPPLGMAVFVVKSTLEDQSISVNDIFAGAFPFFLIMLVVLALVVLYPPIATVLVP